MCVHHSYTHCPHCTDGLCVTDCGSGATTGNQTVAEAVVQRVRHARVVQVHALLQPRGVREGAVLGLLRGTDRPMQVRIPHPSQGTAPAVRRSCVPVRNVLQGHVLRCVRPSVHRRRWVPVQALLLRVVRLVHDAAAGGGHKGRHMLWL